MGIHEGKVRVLGRIVKTSTCVLFAIIVAIGIWAVVDAIETVPYKPALPGVYITTPTPAPTTSQQTDKLCFGKQPPYLFCVQF